MDDLRTDERVIARADDQAMTVRFPPGMLERLDIASKRSGRSRNTDIVMRLLKSLDADDSGLVRELKRDAA